MSKRCRKCKKGTKSKCCHSRKGDRISHGSSKNTVSVRVILPPQASTPAQIPELGTYQEQNRMAFNEIHQLLKKIEPTSVPGAVKSPVSKVEQHTQMNIPNIFIDKGKEKAVDEFTPSPPFVPTYHTDERIRDIVNRFSVEPESPPARNEAESSSRNERMFYHPTKRITIRHGQDAYNKLMDEGHRLQQASPEASKLRMSLEHYRAYFNRYYTQREYPATQPY